MCGHFWRAELLKHVAIAGLWKHQGKLWKDFKSTWAPQKFDVSSKRRVYGLLSVTQNQIQRYKMSGAWDLQIQLRGAFFFPWMYQRWFLGLMGFWMLWEQMLFNSHPPPFPFIRVSLFPSRCETLIFTWRNTDLRLSQYQTKSIFSHLRLFSYCFAWHIKPLPSTYALGLGLHAKA